MLDYSIREPDGILVVKPDGPFTKEDFGGLSAAVDSYLAGHDKLHGVLVQSRKFPGWEDLEGLTAHVRFFREHRRKIERLAVVTDSPVASIAVPLGKHFSSAEVRHFAYADDGKALDWLKTH